MVVFEQKLTSWTPMSLKMKIQASTSLQAGRTLTATVPIRTAWEMFEKARPVGYTNDILVKYENGIAYGEIDMVIWSQVEQLEIIKMLEGRGWKW